MRVGQVFEHHNGTTGETRSYVLEHVERYSEFPARCTLLKIHPEPDPNGKDPHAYVQESTLRRDSDRATPSGSYWHKVAESVEEWEARRVAVA